MGFNSMAIHATFSTVIEGIRSIQSFYEQVRHQFSFIIELASELLHSGLWNTTKSTKTIGQRQCKKSNYANNVHWPGVLDWDYDCAGRTATISSYCRRIEGSFVCFEFLCCIMVCLLSSMVSRVMVRHAYIVRTQWNNSVGFIQTVADWCHSCGTRNVLFLTGYR